METTRNGNNKGWETTRGPRSEVWIIDVVVDSLVLVHALWCWCIHLGIDRYASDLVRGWSLVAEISRCPRVQRGSGYNNLKKSSVTVAPNLSPNSCES